MSEEEKKAIELIQQKSNDDLFYIQCGGSIDKAIVTLLNLIEKQQNRIDELEKALVEEDLKHRNKIKELSKYRDLAKELIEHKIVVADSDSLNYGRAESHDKDIQVLKELLGE